MAGPNQQFDREHVLQFSEGDAQRLAGDYIGTEHLLLGLLRDSEGLAARVLRFGVAYEQLRPLVAMLVRGRPIGGGRIVNFWD